MIKERVHMKIVVIAFNFNLQLINKKEEGEIEYKTKEEIDLCYSRYSIINRNMNDFQNLY